MAKQKHLKPQTRKYQYSAIRSHRRLKPSLLIELIKLRRPIMIYRRRKPYTSRLIAMKNRAPQVHILRRKWWLRKITFLKF